MTLGEAARTLQVSRSAIYGRIGRGTLQMRRNGNRGTLVFLTSSMTAAEHHGDDHPDYHRDVDRDVTVTALRAESGPESDPLFWALLAIAGAATLSNWWLLAPARREA